MLIIVAFLTEVFIMRAHLAREIPFCLQLQMQRQKPPQWSNQIKQAPFCDGSYTGHKTRISALTNYLSVAP